MPRPRRARKVAKWVGLLPTAGLGAVWVFSRVNGVNWSPDAYPSGLQSVAVCRGEFKAVYGINLTRDMRACPPSPPRRGDWNTFDPSVWNLGRPPVWLPRYEGMTSPFNLHVVYGPLWLPLALFTLPTAYLWWADGRRVGPGRCAKCRYDLAGLPAGSGCPECGVKAVAG